MVKPTLSLHRSRHARAAAHRAMAFAALASNSSKSVRYRRFHAHMRLVEALSHTADRDDFVVTQEVDA